MKTLNLLTITAALLVSNAALANAKTLLNCYSKDTATGNSVEIINDDGDVEVRTTSWDGTVNHQAVLTDVSERPKAQLEENKYYIAASSQTTNSAFIGFGTVQAKGNVIAISLGDPDKTVINFKLETVKATDKYSDATYRLVVTSNNSANLGALLDTAGLKSKTDFEVCE